MLILIARDRVDGRRVLLSDPFAGDDPGDVGPVAVSVDERMAVAGSEIAVQRRSGIENVIPQLKMGVIALDPGIEYGPENIFPAGREGIDRGVCLYRRDRARDARANLEVRPDPINRAAFRFADRGEPAAFLPGWHIFSYQLPEPFHLQRLRPRFTF